MKRSSPFFIFTASLLVLPACDKSNNDEQDDTTEDVTSDEKTTDDKTDETGHSDDTTTGNNNTSGDTGEETTTDETETEGKKCDFGCNLYDDDCPADQRCAPTVCDPESGGAWDTDSCVPIGEKNWGEECKAPFDPDATPEDTCGKGLMCWGICLSTCIGSIDEPKCADINEHCLQGNMGALATCMPKCDPFSPDCADTEVCLPAGENPQGFVCIGKSGEITEGNYGETCEYINSCRQGNVCADAGRVDVSGCEDTYCCTTICDLDNPDCIGENEICEPMLQEQIPGHENVGICVIPVSD